MTTPRDDAPLQPGVIELILELTNNKPTLMYRWHLSPRLSLYQYNQAMLGRPVNEEVETAVLEGVDREVERMCAALRKGVRMNLIVLPGTAGNGSAADGDMAGILREAT